MPKSKNTSNTKNKQGSSVSRPAKAKSNTKKPLLSSIGKFVGNIIHPSLGNIGSNVGSAIDKIFGSGDYTVRGNSIMSGQAPSFSSSENGIRVSHREYVSDMQSSTLFSNISYQINPGNVKLFPWLSNVAKNFETYDLHGLVMYYKPLSGTAISSTNPAQGAVIFSTNYDVLNPSFVSKQEAEAYQFTTSTVPYNPMVHPVECKPSLTPLPRKYITDKEDYHLLASDDDPRLHYHGAFQAMTFGQQSNGANLGEMWISYDITLYTPKKPSESDTNIALFYGKTSNVDPGFGLDACYRMEPSLPSIQLRNVPYDGTHGTQIVVTEPGNYFCQAWCSYEAGVLPYVASPFTHQNLDNGVLITDIKMRSASAQSYLLNPTVPTLLSKPINVGESAIASAMFNITQCTARNYALINVPDFIITGSNKANAVIGFCIIKVGGHFTADFDFRLGQTLIPPASESVSLSEKNLEFRIKQILKQIDPLETYFQVAPVVERETSNKVGTSSEVVGCVINADNTKTKVEVDPKRVPL
jgi:hypothetical protein